MAKLLRFEDKTVQDTLARRTRAAQVISGPSVPPPEGKWRGEALLVFRHYGISSTTLSTATGNANAATTSIAHTSTPPTPTTFCQIWHSNPPSAVSPAASSHHRPAVARIVAEISNWSRCWRFPRAHGRSYFGFLTVEDVRLTVDDTLKIDVACGGTDFDDKTAPSSNALPVKIKVSYSDKVVRRQVNA